LPRAPLRVAANQNWFPQSDQGFGPRNRIRLEGRSEVTVSDRLRGIWNCPTLQLPVLSFQCPQAWQALAESDNPTIRNCPACQKQVHLCTTPEEFIRAGQQGHCVAIPDSVRPIHLAECLVGRPSDESRALFIAEQNGLIGWWSAVIEQLPQALGNQLNPMRARLEGQKNYLSNLLNWSHLLD
jgi:hypothetical protein